MKMEEDLLPTSLRGDSLTRRMKERRRGTKKPSTSNKKPTGKGGPPTVAPVAPTRPPTPPPIVTPDFFCNNVETVSIALEGPTFTLDLGVSTGIFSFLISGCYLQGHIFYEGSMIYDFPLPLTDLTFSGSSTIIEMTIGDDVCFPTSILVYCPSYPREPPV